MGFWEIGNQLHMTELRHVNAVNAGISGKSAFDFGALDKPTPN
jgi:hypothetical protein